MLRARCGAVCGLAALDFKLRRGSSQGRPSHDGSQAAADTVLPNAHTMSLTGCASTQESGNPRCDARPAGQTRACVTRRTHTAYQSGTPNTLSSVHRPKQHIGRCACAQIDSLQPAHCHSTHTHWTAACHALPHLPCVNTHTSKEPPHQTQNTGIGAGITPCSTGQAWWVIVCLGHKVSCVQSLHPSEDTSIIPGVTQPCTCMPTTNYKCTPPSLWLHNGLAGNTHPPTQCWLQQCVQRTAGSHGK